MLTSPEVGVPHGGVARVHKVEGWHVVEMAGVWWEPEGEVGLQFVGAHHGEMEAHAAQFFHLHGLGVDVFQDVPLAQKLFCALVRGKENFIFRIFHIA